MVRASRALLPCVAGLCGLVALFVLSWTSNVTHAVSRDAAARSVALPAAAVGSPTIAAAFVGDPEPMETAPLSRLANDADFMSDRCQAHLAAMSRGGASGDVPHRGAWELCAVVDAVVRGLREQTGRHITAARGLGLGVGKDALARHFASLGAVIHATDYAGRASVSEWLGAANDAAVATSTTDVCGTANRQRCTFAHHVSLAAALAAEADNKYDFVWSRQVTNALDCDAAKKLLAESARLLAPGGIAVHTLDVRLSRHGAAQEGACAFTRDELDEVAQTHRIARRQWLVGRVDAYAYAVNIFEPDARHMAVRRSWTSPIITSGILAIPAHGARDGALRADTAAAVAARFRVASLTSFAGKERGSEPEDPSLLCSLFMIAMADDPCGLATHRSSPAECVARFTPNVLEAVIPERCTNTSYWRHLAAAALKLAPTPGTDGAAAATAAAGDILPLRNSVQRQQTYAQEHRYVPPGKRFYTDLGPTTTCTVSGETLHGLILTMPSVNFAPRVTRHKLFDFNPLCPGVVLRGNYLRQQHPVGVHDEALLQALTGHSYFSYSHYRGGWDVMRNLEIFANGAIPYMPDVDQCGAQCMHAYPKAWTSEAMRLRGLEHMARINASVEEHDDPYMWKEKGRRWIDFKKPGTIAHDRFDHDGYFRLADRIHNYSKHHLTCEAFVAAVLRTIGIEEPRSVLLVENPVVETTTFTVRSGLAGLGINHTVVRAAGQPPLQWENEPARGTTMTEADVRRMRDERGFAQSYGFGFLFGGRVNPAPHAPIAHDEARRRIRAGEYDVVFARSLTQPNAVDLGALFDDALAHLPRRRVVVMFGMDVANIDAMMPTAVNVSKRGATVFVRELWAWNKSKC